jgi:hypothetical protein
LSTPLSPHFLDSIPLSPIMSSLHDISGQILSSGKSYVLFGQVTHNNETILKNLYIFLLGRPPNTKRPPWKSFCFSPGQVVHYNETILKNLCIFHLSRSPITMRPLWKIATFFTWTGRPLQYTTLKTFHFPPGQVTHYNEITLKNLCIFHVGSHPL